MTVFIMIYGAQVRLGATSDADYCMVSGLELFFDFEVGGYFADF